MEELIEIVNEQGVPTWVIISKDEAHRIGALHRVIHLHMYDAVGNILFQQRAQTKKFYPWVLDFAVWGHIRAGEDVLAWLSREAYEELWLTLDHSCLALAWVFLHTIEHPQYNMLDNEVIFDYMYRYDGDIGVLTFLDGEVAGIQSYHIHTLLDASEEAYQQKNIRWYKRYPDVMKKIASTIL